MATLTSERFVEVYHTGDQEDDVIFAAIEPETRRQISNFIFVQTPPGGSEAAFDRLQAGGAIFVASTVVSRDRSSSGDTFTLDTPRGTHAFEVAAEVVDFAGNGLMVYGSWNDLNRYFGIRDADSFIIAAEPGVQAEALADTLQKRFGERLNLSIDTVQDLLAAVFTINDQSFALFDTLAFIMVAVSAAGVINTMTISVLERGAEIATLRSLGFTRGQIRSMVLGEKRRSYHPRWWPWAHARPPDLAHVHPRDRGAGRLHPDLHPSDVGPDLGDADRAGGVNHPRSAQPGRRLAAGSSRL